MLPRERTKESPVVFEIELGSTCEEGDPENETSFAPEIQGLPVATLAKPTVKTRDMGSNGEWRWVFPHVFGKARENRKMILRLIRMVRPPERPHRFRFEKVPIREFCPSDRAPPSNALVLSLFATGGDPFVRAH